MGDFKKRIEDGQSGKYKGLKNGLNRLNSYIFGWQRACFLLLGGMSGSAKTTLADFMLLEAIQDARANNTQINVFYYCLEINEETKKANWLAQLIYKKYKKVVAPEKIQGLGDSRLTAEEQSMVDQVYPELEVIWNMINWTFVPINPTGIYNNFWKFMEKRGTFEYEEYINEKGEKDKKIVRFVNNDSEEYNIIMLDHLANLKYERGFDLKQNIDKMSEYAVVLRNLFKTSILFIQQFNQGLSNIDRVKYMGVDLEPAQTDFKDSTTPYADADIVLGLLNAYKMKLDTYLGYDINKSQKGLKHRFRALKVIKNRLSRDDVMIGLLFHPEAGRFEELPPANEMTDSQYEYVNKL